MKLMISLIAAIAVAGFAAWRIANAPRLGHAIGIVDPSGSRQRNCPGFVSQVQTLTEKPGMMPRSTFGLFIIGDSARAPQPRVALDVTIPFARDRVFGHDAAKVQEERQSFLGAVQKACGEAREPRDSPILEAVRQAIAHLRARGCRADGRCYLLVQTDLAENVDPTFLTAVKSVRQGKGGMTPVLDHPGIEILFFGVSEFLGGASSHGLTTEQLASIWKGLSHQPELMSFQPFYDTPQGLAANPSMPPSSR